MKIPFRELQIASSLNLALCASLCMYLTGCDAGTRLVPVTGSISVKGKPAAGASILFHAEDPAAQTVSAVTAEDGTFSLMSGTEPGIAPGNYVVTVTWPDASKKPTSAQIMMGTADAGPDLLKGKYATKSASTLKVEITTSTTALPAFEL